MARAVAYRVMAAVDRGRRLDRALEVEARDLASRERSWVQALTFGTMRLRGRIDYLLDGHLHRGLDSVSPPLRTILRLGVYQLLYMDAVPDYAAVSQAVEQARQEAGRRSGGLVNGVLRSVQRGGAPSSVFPSLSDDAVGHLSTWGSHPRWLVERWVDRWGSATAERLVEYDNRVPELFVRPVGVASDEAVRMLSDRHVEVERVGRGTGALRVADGSDPVAALDAAPVVVQDPGAALVVAYAAPEPGSTIADLCAAPGGKGLALAPDAFYVLAGDASAGRLDLIRENAARLRRFPSVRLPLGTVVARAEVPPLAAESVDFLLLDVPCTGTGTLRRHPDGRWRLDPESPRRMAELQRKILEGAAARVRRGGLLVYSTCSLEPEENEDLVLDFLSERRDFEVEPRDSVPSLYLDEDGFLQVRPQDTGFDGAFAARLRRTR